MTVERTPRPIIPCSHCPREFKPTMEQYERFQSGLPVCCRNSCRLEFAREQKIKAHSARRELTCGYPECGKRFLGTPWQYKRDDEGLPVYHSPSCARRRAVSQAKADGTPDAPFLPKLEAPVRCPWETGALKRSSSHCPFP